MRKILTVLTACAMLTACSEKESEQLGWVMLFDGKSTSGWHSYERRTSAKAWKVENGILHLNAESKEYDDASVDLVTDESFDNFHLKLEWKVAPGGNSGILFYVQDELEKYERTWMTGPEMQLLDNARHSDAQVANRKAGDLYDLIAGKPDNVKPAGEWNQAEIICDKGRLQFFQNGENILSVTLWDENWEKLIAQSKFKAHPDFGTFRSGKIVLQDHGDEVWFRNILIKKL